MKSRITELLGIKYPIFQGGLMKAKKIKQDQFGTELIS